jgi:valyl-tRNA synthetase
VTSAPVRQRPAKRGGTAEGISFRPQLDESLYLTEVVMPLLKHYDHQEVELRLQVFWESAQIYRFSPEGPGETYSIDTPPATVSGNLHLGHAYSYTHPDLIARFRRMRGEDVFYPMGYDDNGLPTERLVERELGVTAAEIGRSAFIDKCLQASERAEQEYQALWQRLGLSIDWRFTYRTIDDRSRWISQKSFLDLYRKGLAYRQQAPVIWCPNCRTAIAQAEVNDLERAGEFITLAFHLEDGEVVPIATTRPELLPACVAVFVHPQDLRFNHLVGRQVTVPLFGQQVPVLADPRADPEKGTGVVMCCTFGDSTDKEWWFTHQLPLIEAISRDGRLTPVAGEFAGLGIDSARREVAAALESRNMVIGRQPVLQTVRMHERCDTPVELLVSQQWFIRVLDQKPALLEAGERIRWIPEHMGARYHSWVENLAWDWCISRQRYFGVPFPLWYCQACGDVILAGDHQLPVDPVETQPPGPCSCGSQEFCPEADVMDTWATSSLTPQIVGGWSAGEDESGEQLYENVFPFSLRPQGHEIIRTWAFYTIVKSLDHFAAIPWKDVSISGWGIAGEGMGKISKSRGGGPLAPMEMIERYSADAVRYWAASTGLGKNAVISEEKIQAGSRLVTKIWNTARFSERFLDSFDPEIEITQAVDEKLSIPPVYLSEFTPADRWILSKTQRLVRRVTGLLEEYDHAAAKSEIESFFWDDFADNYLEMCKQRLYAGAHPRRKAACFTLYHVLLTTIQLFAPFLPFVTEEIYQGIFVGKERGSSGKPDSIHRSKWPVSDERFIDEAAELTGERLVAIATAVRRFKSERSLPLGTELQRLELVAQDQELASRLRDATSDLLSVTRARTIEVVDRLSSGQAVILADRSIELAITNFEPTQE